MMANGMRFPVFVGKAHATTFRLVEWEASGGFDCFCPLPSPLPRGEGTNCRESQQWSDFSHPIPSLRGKENKLQGIATIVEFQLSDSLSVGEGANCRESQQWSDFSYLIPSPRGRGLGRGQSRFGTPLSRFSKKPPFKTDTDKRDCRAWMSDLVP